MKLTAGHAAFDASSLISVEESKEVFAHFGMAMHIANVLEHGVANAVFVAILLPKIREFKTAEAWSDAIDVHFERMFSLTYGNMIRELNGTRAYSDEIMEKLYATKRTRDHLVHHFQREAAELMLTPIGREQMIEKYLQIIEEFGAGDEALKAEIGPIRNRLGASDEWLNEAYERGIQRSMAEAGGTIDRPTHQPEAPARRHRRRAAAQDACRNA